MGYPAIDQPAPTIEVSEWISGTPEKENGFSGKNVILEFWGTHCGPCIAAIPHLNELVATYGSKDTLFVSLTREEPHTIERFLEKKADKGRESPQIERVQRSMPMAYEVSLIPFS